MRRWFTRGVRLAVVVACVAAGWHAWSTFSRYAHDKDEWLQMRFVYECAARHTDAELTKHANEFGNVNVRNVFCSSTDAWVSLPEMQRVRSGTMKFETPYRPFDRDGTIFMALLGGGITLIITAIMIGLVQLFRWVWGTGFADGS